MQHYTTFLAAFLALLLHVGLVQPSALGQPDPSGSWQGSLEVQGTELHIVFHVEPGDDGRPTATMDSPDQGATGIPVSEVRATDDSLHLRVPAIGGAFEGAFQEEGAAIDGTWQQSGQEWPLVLERVSGEEATSERRRPQEPEPPFPYTAEEVTFENMEDGVTLAGTLTLPESEGPHPALALISGSGPQDRNEEIFGHKPFLVLADYLTRRGVAVLRYDDRGVGASTGTFETATTEAFARDAEAAVDYLRGRPDIKASEVGLLGHSEGGLVAPMVAARTDKVAFLVLLAPPGVPGEEIIYEQAALISEVQGADPAYIDSSRAQQERLFAALKEAPDSAEAARRLREILEASQADSAAIRSQIQQYTTPWFRNFLTYDPQPVLEKVEVPVLALFGEKDLQVPYEQNYPAVEEALKAGGHEDYALMELPDLNHLFQPAETGAPAEYGQIETTMAPEALEIIGDWIAARTSAAQNDG